jgi:cytochrome c
MRMNQPRNVQIDRLADIPAETFTFSSGGVLHCCSREAMLRQRIERRRPTVKANHVIARILLAAALAAWSAAAHAEPFDGDKLFKQQCAVCHSVEPGKTVVGPSLYGVVDRLAGSDSTFRYSRGLKDSGLTWTKETLGDFIEAPRKLVPGSNMAFAGERTAEKRDAIIEYLGSLK